jgi:hypothetical protein
MKRQIVFAIIRHLLTALGGVLVTRGTLDSAGLETVIGAIMAILGVVWSTTHKINSETVDAAQSQTWLGGPADKSDRAGDGNRGYFPKGNVR